MRRPLVLALSGMAACLVLAACGDGSGADEAPEGGDVPVTPGAVAWLASEVAGEPDSGQAEDPGDFEELGKPVVSVDLRYGSDGEYDGNLLGVIVTPRLPEGAFDCEREEYLAGCEVLDGGATLAWEAQAPEEDPGVIYLLVPKGDGAALVYQAGPDVTDDPRELDLAITVDDMLAIGEDPRVDVTTTQEAVDAGDDLPWFDPDTP